jgi:CSLREA domain-containing protein
MAVAIVMAFVCTTFFGPGLIAQAAKAPPICSLVPDLRDVTVNQGVGAYTPLVRGKETLVRAYLSKPACAATGAIIELTGGSLSVAPGTAPAVPIPAPTPRPTAPFPQVATATVAPLVDSTADPIFVVPGSALAPSNTTARFTATFRVTITYQSRTSSTATPVPGTITFTSRTGSTTPITATIEKLTNALRVLVVPMGDTSKPFASSYTAPGDAALQAAMLTMSRIYPVPDGVGSLTGTAGGLRYSVSPGMLDLRALLGTDGRFCGTGGSTGNFNAVKASLGQFLQSWNAANGSANQADRVLGVVDAAISNGSALGCAEGMAAINSNEAWIRAVPELQGVPSQSGFVAALELGHTFGLVLGGPSPTPDRDDLFSKYHSPNVYADPLRTNRSYNTRLRSVLVDDRTAMTYIGTANNNNTLLEQLDWAYLICRLGGATSTECPTPAVPVGSGAGVAAGPRFVISGVTDGTATGTHVLESFFSANMLPTPQNTASQYRLVYRSSSGAILSNFGLPAQAEDSAHSHDDDGPVTGNLTLFSGAFDFPGTPNRIELWRGAPGSGALLYARDRTAAPVITSLSVTAGTGGPVDFTNDPEDIDFAPALSADGRWLAWASFFPTEDTPSIAIRVAPIDDVSQQARLTEGGDDVDSFDPEWCADGGRIAYVDNAGDLWIVGVNTGAVPATFGAPVRIYDSDVDGPPAASHPTWSPDCSQLAFEADDDIWRINADGSNVVALTDDDSSHAPSWSPDPDDKRIAYIHDTASALAGPSIADAGTATYASFVQPTPDQPVGVFTHGGLHLVVTSSADPGDGVCDADCTLREAINAANAAPNGLAPPDEIDFQIDPSGAHTIAPLSALPAITEAVIIDGATQPGWAVGAPVIVIDGTAAGVGAVGLSITGGGSTVRGLVVGNFAGNSAIAISGSGGNRIEASFIGTDETGTSAAANSIGVRVSGSPDNVIGGTVAGTGNVISGNTDRNLIIESSASTGNLVAGNRIGTNAAGTAQLEPVGMFHVGIQVASAIDSTIGGTSAAERNVISGNGYGIQIVGSMASGNDVVGNFIGTDVTGSASISNGQVGVLVFGDAHDNVIGGTAAGAGNVISGNSVGAPSNLSGISFSGATTTANVVQGNLIGLAADGTTALPNKQGIEVNGAPANVIGGTTAGARNIISGNLGLGFNIGNPGATGTIIRGNFIGTDVTGLLDRGNSVGIAIGNATGTIIGGSAAGAGNVISGNVQGINVSTGSDGSVIRGNLIGTDASGTGALGNSNYGVNVAASNASVGGIAAGDGNVIANNGAAGITVTSNTITPVGNRISGNAIQANGGLGIDLAPNGVNPNDADDTDAGVNNLQNFPVVTEAVGDGVTTTVDGTLTSTADTAFRVEAFANDACDGSGNGEGGRFLGATTVVTDGSGTGSFTFSGISNAEAPVGDFITTTATDQGSDNTSEFSACLVVSAPPVETATFTVNATDDNDDGLCGTIHCSLREAIKYANATAGFDTITFDIGGGGTQTIAVTDALPAITESVAIDGTTQPGWVDTPVIEIDGSAADPGSVGVDGLVIGVGGDLSTIRGLAINDFSRDGISVSADNAVIEGSYIGVGLDGSTGKGNGKMGVQVLGASGTRIGTTDSVGTGNVISDNGQHGISVNGGSALDPVDGTRIGGNLIGTDAAGAAALGNAAYGIFLNAFAQNSLVGGTAAEERNVISANVFGIVVADGADANTIQGNRIGTDFTGLQDLGNAGGGIEIVDADSTMIGGSAAGAGNVISGNGSATDGANGIRITGSQALNTQIYGNLIGVGVTGLPLGNSTNGIDVNAGASQGRIGSTGANGANTIASNGEDGILVAGGNGNTIRANSIHDNGGLGIDLGPDGVTPNDTSDPDTGANDLQNFPLITLAQSDGVSTTVNGTINTLPSSPQQIDLYVSASCDASGNGEGSTWLAEQFLITDGSGDGSFSVPGLSVSPGQVITVTGTEGVSNSTSEFSACVTVTAASGSGDEVRLLDPATPLGPTTFVVNGSDPAWRGGSILYSTDGEIHSILPDGSGDETITSSFPDSSPAGAPGVTAFVRTQGGDDDIWLIVDGDTVNVTATDQTPENLRLDLFYVCGGQSMPIAVALTPDTTGVTTANFQTNYDPSLSCAGGTIEAALTDGFLRTTTPPGSGEPVASDPKPPVAATYGPPLGSTYLTSDVIPFHGIGEDADDGTLTGASLRWFIRPAAGPCCGTLAGTGGSVDYQAAGLAPGDYIVTLVAVDADGGFDSAESLIHVLADSDHDGFSDAAETGPCFGDGAATNGSTPSGDADGDGLPNASDPEPCVRATLYTAIVDFNPNDLNLSASGTPITVAIQTPGRDIRQIVGSTVQIIGVGGAPVNFGNVGWSVSGSIGTAKFSRQQLVTFLKNNGVGTATVPIVLSGSSNTNPTWSFQGRDTTNAKP